MKAAPPAKKLTAGKTGPEIYYDRLAKLTPEEKQELRRLIQSPLYVKLLRIAAGLKPSPNCARAGSGERDEFSDARASARLAEMRGWDLHQHAIFMALNDAAPPRGDLQPSYPDSGILDLQPRTA